MKSTPVKNLSDDQVIDTNGAGDAFVGGESLVIWATEIVNVHRILQMKLNYYEKLTFVTERSHLYFSNLMWSMD